MEVALTAEGFKEANAHAMSTGDQVLVRDWLESVDILNSLYNGVNWWHNTREKKNRSRKVNNY